MSGLGCGLLVAAAVAVGGVIMIFTPGDPSGPCESTSVAAGTEAASHYTLVPKDRALVTRWCERENSGTVELQMVYSFDSDLAWSLCDLVYTGTQSAAAGVSAVKQIIVRDSGGDVLHRCDG